MSLVPIAALALAVPFADVPKAAVDAAVAKFADKKLRADQVGVTIARIDGTKIEYARHRGDWSVYPASVVKMFYLAFAAHRLEDGKLALSDEMKRAVTDMIVDSSNDATGYVLDAACGTTPGPELPEAEQRAWNEKRLAVNRWYESLGYTGVNARHRTYNEGPYGRERAAYGPDFSTRNMLTTDACARLMAEIMTDRTVSPKQCEWMRGVLRRDNPADGGKNDQATEFLGRILPKGTTLYSKAGWVNEYRHDVAGFVLPNGHRYVFAVFTRGHGDEIEILPYIGSEMLRLLGEPTAEGA